MGWLVAENVVTAYGLLGDLVKLYPELQKVFDLINKGDDTQAELEFYKTGYYQNLSSTAKDRAKKKASQPGLYLQELDAFKQTQRIRLTQKGITVDDAILEDAFLKGYTENQVDALALSKFTGKIGGTTIGNVQNLNEYANQFGMSYNQATLDSWSKGIAGGTTTVYDVQSKIRQDAASAYPVYADGLLKGTSLDALASAYKSSMANILEIDPDAISWNDPTLRTALQYVDTNGKPAMKPIWQFENELRNDPRWEYTNNARAKVDSLSLKVLRTDWGLV